MNSLLKTLNVWADHALGFAWPMLWQSSLLIGVLFALDLVLRKKLRPAVRYALWLVVVVKVLLPPSLAFPTGPSWWLRPAKTSGRASVSASPDFQGDGRDQGSRGRSPSQQSGLGNAPDRPALPSAVTPVLTTPYRPRLSPAAWTFAGMVSVSLGLFAWMLVRWYQVARDARRAAAAPAWLGELLPEQQRPARIRLTDRPQSPAVCGLFRPVILLPRALADHLPPAQLRAVLLHELVHLRRGDVWVNCLQALVQILYWWHPLLWLANARIRRVREEAVDDAVMLALNEDAETYAPTLLEVAKLSLSRPLASLGLVGILESRSSLRQRIERLLDFRPPRKAGLTLGSALAVVGFAAVAVPMGEAPAPTEAPRSAASQVLTNGSVSYGLSSPSPGRQAILTKLDRIRFDSVSFNGLPLSEVVRFLVEESKKRDPEKRGINFLVNQDVDSGSAGAPAATPLGPDGQLVPATATEPVDMSAVAVKINPPLVNIRLADVLDAIVMVADQPIKYTIEDYAIVFSPRRREATSLYVRTFKVDPDTFLAGLGAATGTAWGYGPLEVAPAFVNFLAKAGVDLDPTKSPGKALFWNDRQSVLLVRGTMQDLDSVERAIASLAVPMREAPATNQLSQVPENQVGTNASASADSSSPGLRLDRKLKISRLVHDGKLLYEMGRTTAAEAKLKEALKQDPQNQAAAYYLKLLSQHRVSRLVDDGKRLYEQGWLEEAELDLEKALKEDPQDIRATHYLKLVREALHKTTGGLRKALPSPNPYSRTNLVHTGQGRQAIIAKLDSIRLDRVTFDGLSLREVMQRLAGEARKRDPEKRGIDLLVILDPTPEDIGAMPIKISPPLTNIRLRDVLDAIVKAADRPIKYSIEDYAIVFSPKERETPALYARRYEVGTNAFLNGLRTATGLAVTNRSESIVPALRDFLAEAGVDLDSRRNPEKYLFWTERPGRLLVRATLQDLDIIEAVIQMLNTPPEQDSGIRQSTNLVAPVVAPGSNERPGTIAQAKPIAVKGSEELARQSPPPTLVVNPVPPQIHIKCKLVEASEDDWVDDSKPLGYDWYMSSVPRSARTNGWQAGSDHSSTSMSPFTQAGSLSDPQRRMLMKALQQRIGAEFLGDTGVSANSGRQVQCKATYVQNVFKGISEQALTFPGISSTNDDESSAYGTKSMEFGVSLDLLPTVTEDGYTVNLSVIATVLGFLGYADTRTNSLAVYINGKEKWATPPMPRVRIQHRASTVNVRDGQTVVLVAPVPERIANLTGQLPVLGNVLGSGPLFRSDSTNTEKRNLLVFLTPTIIDAAGNPVHGPDEAPLPRGGTPTQPTR